jgi:hypothetical protein
MPAESADAGSAYCPGPNPRSDPLSSLRARAKSPQRSDVLWETWRPAERPPAGPDHGEEEVGAEEGVPLQRREVPC